MKSTYTAFFIVLTILSMAQGSSPKFSKENPDRIAIFYMHCEDVKEERLISTKDLYDHYLGENGPVRSFWKANFNDQYYYTGKVFRVEIPMKEDKFAVDQAKEKKPRLIEHLERRLKLANKYNLNVTGFDQNNFDKIILLLGEESLHSLGEYKGTFKVAKLQINGEEVEKPILSGKGIKKPSTDVFTLPVSEKVSEGIQTRAIFPARKYLNFNLWTFYDGMVLHEWGHSFNANHANMPCGDEKCGRFYEQAQENYFDFTVNFKEVWLEYADPFCIMGGVGASIVMNAAMLDKSGMLPEKDKITISESKTDIKLRPYLNEDKAGHRAAVIQIDKELSLPLIKPREDEYEYIGNLKPTHKLDLYVEYRRGESYDTYLNQEKLIENTKGLMIHLSLKDVVATPYRYKDENGQSIDATPDHIKHLKKDFEEHTWLLDMSPTDGTYNVTLNAGWEFYHDEWEISIKNVRPGGDEGITFDVEYGKKEGIKSGVYRTALLPGKTIEDLNSPLLYSAGLKYRLEYTRDALQIIDNATNNVVSSATQGVFPTDLYIDKLQMDKGKLVLYNSGSTVWETEDTDHPEARLVISKEGKLKREAIRFLKQKNDLSNFLPNPTINREYAVFVNLNGDDNIDLVSQKMSPERIITILFGNGKGSFEKKESFKTCFISSSSSKKFELADLDKDKNIDIIFLDDSGQWQILFNDGTGNFKNRQNNPFPQERKSCIKTSDIDFDGDNDIVFFMNYNKDDNGFMSVGNDDDVQSTMYLNNGEGIFKKYEDAYDFSFLDSELYAKNSFFLDLDGDIDPDFYCNDGNTLYTNDGKGNFSFKRRLLPVSIGGSSNNPAFLDADNDGDKDMILSLLPSEMPRSESDNLLLYLNSGKGEYTDSKQFFTGKYLRTSDINADGTEDVLTYKNDELLLYINNGIGNFSKPKKGIHEISKFGTATDIDGNGYNDIWVSYRNKGVEVGFLYLNDTVQLSIENDSE